MSLRVSNKIKILTNLFIGKVPILRVQVLKSLTEVFSTRSNSRHLYIKVFKTATILSGHIGSLFDR